MIDPPAECTKIYEIRHSVELLDSQASPANLSLPGPVHLEGDVSVHALCPGPVASNIAREAPAIARPFAKLFFTLFFQPPRVAARPVVYLALSPRIAGTTGRYQFLLRSRDPSAEADSAENGRRLWERLEELLPG